MLQIRLLGQFDVRVDGKRVTITTRAAQSLLAYLVLTAGNAQRREKLAGMLWPEISDENARKNLRQELWRIRKAISTLEPGEGDYLIADDLTLKFNRKAEYWLDVYQMEKPDLDLQSLIANLTLYQGELLPGFYDEWITLERERVQAVFDARMEQLVEQLMAAERWIAVQEWGERWLSLSGVREPAYRALMLATGVRGDMAKVSSLYQRCTNELKENLGVEPSPETRALYHGLLKGTRIAVGAATAQPSGTITFLFTDIESSTRLLEKLGDHYAAALSKHHEILRASIQRWNGREMDTQGDAFFVTFTRAIDAVQCAAEAQRALASHSWPQDESLRVRMGLHTGEPLISSTGYVGMDVHRAARIGDAGHGGQILLSQTTRELIIQDLPEGMAIRDLGEHRLKDMKYPGPIYQLVVEGLQAEFPPLRTKFSGSEAPTPGQAPFKGLQFFDVDDSDLFFGRETLTVKLLNRLREASFLSVIIGASGSGKSSLVRAGVIPALRKGGSLINGTQPLEGSGSWKAHIITPTAHPLEALAIELTRDSESVTAAATLADDLSKDPRSLHFFLSRRAQTDHSLHTLLVIDQFEELFTLCRDEFEREAFIDNLLTAISSSLSHAEQGERGDETARLRGTPAGKSSGEDNITLIITLRADFYAYLAQYPELRDAVAQQQEYIGPMTAEELRRAIEEPARRGHWEFEPGLVDLILRDVGDEPGALPLLSHALLETWKRRAGPMLTLKGYADAGGVHGAIAHTAESLYQTLSPVEQMITQNILLRLTEFGEGTEDTRRRASFRELMSSVEDPAEVRAVLNRLAEARLVILSEDTADVAHEALIREWPRLREWLSQDREGMLLHRRLTEAAQEWELLERSADILYRGARLSQAREWALTHGVKMNELEREFLQASLELTEREAGEREAQYQRELDNARKLAEAERQRAEMESQRAAELAIINSIQQGMTSQLEMQAIYDLVGDKINEITGAETVLIHVWDLQKGMRYDTYSREKGERFSSWEHPFTPLENLMIPDLQQGKTILWNEGIKERVDKFGHRHVVDGSELALSLVVVPLKTGVANQNTITAISVQDNSREYAFNESDVRLVETIANSMSVALEKARLFDETQRLFKAEQERVAELQIINSIQQGLAAELDFRAIVNLVGDKLRELFKKSDLGIDWHDEKADLMYLLYAYEHGKRLDLPPVPTPLAFKTMAESRKPLIARTVKDMVKLGFELVPGTDKSQSLIYVPIISIDRVIGAISVEDYERPDAFGESEIRLLTTIAASLGTALENARLFDETQRLLKDAKEQRDAAINAQAIAEAERVRAENEKKLATSRELAIAAVNNLKIDPERSVLLTLHALSQSHTKEAEEALHQSMQALRTKLKLIGHTGWVNDVDFSPDGKRLATSSSDKTARVWDAITGMELFTLSGHSDEIGVIAYSPDGTRLATASEDRTAKAWDANTGDELFTFSGHTQALTDIAFSPDSTRLATSSGDKTAKVWDVSTGEEIFTLTGHTDIVNEVVFSPDGTRLATSSDDRTARVWDANTGEEIFTLTGHTDIVNEVVFSPDGRRLATSSRNGTTIIWDPATGQEILRIEDEGTIALAFSPDVPNTQAEFRGTLLVTGTTGGLVKVWDAISGERRLMLSGHSTLIHEVAFSPNGTHLASSSNDGTVKIWDIARGQELMTLAGHDGIITSISFSPDGSLLASASEDMTARIWDLSPSASREFLTIAGGRFKNIALRQDEKRMITTSFDTGIAQVWDAETGENLLVIAGHKDTVHTAVYSPDGTRIATTSADNSVKIWEAVSGKELRTLIGHGSGTIGRFYSGVLDAAYSPDGERLATAGADSLAKVWDATTGEELLILSGHTAGLTRVVFSPDGSLLATASDEPDSTARIWDAATGKEIHILEGHPVRIWGLAFSPDGKCLATGGWGGVIKIWDVATGDEVMELPTQNGTVTSLAFTTDGTRLASGVVSGQIKLWDAATGLELLSLPAPKTAIWAVIFNRSGTRLFTAARDGIRVYALRLEDLIDLAQSRLTRSLTPEECKTYLHLEECPAEP